MTDAWYPWDSNGTWDDEEWPRPEGPSEWALFRQWTLPKTVITDAAASALEKGEPVDSVLITFVDQKMVVEAPMGVWNHVLTALHHEEKYCAECGEVLDVFRRVAETLADEEEDDAS